VITAGNLLLNNDPVAIWLFSASECADIGHFLDDYNQARKALVQIRGALADGRQYPISIENSKVSDADYHGMMLQSCAEGARRAEAAASEPYRDKLSGFDEATREDLMVIVFGIRLFVWKRTLTGLYGPGYFETILAAQPQATWALASLAMLARIENFYSRALGDAEPTTGFSNWLVAGLVLDLLDGKPASMRTDHNVQACSALFEREVFHFSHYVRYLIRFMIAGDTEGTAQSMREDSLL
jgi:hypothetical protein